MGPGRWARHGGLGPKVNHSCDPNCGVRLNDGQAFDFVARRRIGPGQELTFDYAMRNFTIDHFPAVCLCGAARCRGSVTGWKDLPAARKADYGDLVAPLPAHDGRRDPGGAPARVPLAAARNPTIGVCRHSWGCVALARGGLRAGALAALDLRLRARGLGGLPSDRPARPR